MVFVWLRSASCPSGQSRPRVALTKKPGDLLAVAAVKLPPHRVGALLAGAPLIPKGEKWLAK